MVLGVSGELGLHGIFHIRKKIKTKREFSFLSLATAPKFFFLLLQVVFDEFFAAGGTGSSQQAAGGEEVACA